jgi:hypothetical protein
VVQFLDAPKPWKNVRFRGEDLKLGAVLGEPGDGLGAARLGLPAAAGLMHVRADRRPVVGLLATGSELLEAGQPLAPGKIYESNRTGLAALAARAGAIPHLLPLVAHSLPDTVAALENAFSRCDVLVSSGGVSAGETDFVKYAFKQLGGIDAAKGRGEPARISRRRGGCHRGNPGRNRRRSKIQEITESARLLLRSGFGKFKVGALSFHAEHDGLTMQSAPIAAKVMAQLLESYPCAVRPGNRIMARSATIGKPSPFPLAFSEALLASSEARPNLSSRVLHSVVLGMPLGALAAAPGCMKMLRIFSSRMSGMVLVACLRSLRGRTIYCVEGIRQANESNSNRTANIS